MSRYLKSYHIFLNSKIMKSIMYIFYPILFIFLTWMIGSIIEWENLFFIFSGIAIISAEIFLDFFIYGGILCRDTNKLGYLHTSKKCEQILKAGFVVDKLRRIVEISIIIVISMLLLDMKFNFWSLQGMIFIAAIVIEMILPITRGITQITFGTLFAMLASVLFVSFDVLNIFLLKIWQPLSLVWVVIYVVVFICTQKIIVKKMEEQYYDSRY